MGNKKTLVVTAVVATILAIGALTWASGTGTKVPLMALKPHPNATGTAFIGDGAITIEAQGLKPDSVYTAWFVNMTPKKHVAGAGTAPYMFKTDSEGKGVYNSTLDGLPFGNWAMLMVVLHPNGDPTDMKNMVGALSGKL